MKYFLSVVVLACSFTLFAQEKGKGVISGTVLDETAATYPSAKVELVGVKTILTDFDGKFKFAELAPGTYTIIVKTPDYSDKIMQGIVVNNDEVTIVDVPLSTNTLVTVEIIGKPRKQIDATDVGVTLLQRNAKTFVDVVSIQTASKTSASNAGDVVKMSSGASIQDGKFVVIRGLNDRYNAAFLNGSPLPSTESDRKAFAFDMFPSSMLDNMVIAKTATPEMPGEFAGGIIQINTKSIPDKNYLTLSVGGSYNTITTFKPRTSYEGGKLDWIGVDNGARAMSTAIPEYGSYPITINGQASLAQQFSTSWALIDSKFSPNYSFQFSSGYVDSIAGKEFGITTALTYSRKFSYNETIRKGYTNGADGAASQLDYEYLDHNNGEQVLAGGLANFAIKLNDKNEISFKNIYSINSDDKLIARTGEINPLETNPSLLRSNARWFTSNKVYSGQLMGSHHLNEKLKLNWLTGYSNVNRTIPSLRRTIYTRSKYINDPTDPNPADTMYVANMSYSSVGPNYSGGMFYSENKEHSFNNRLDIAYTFDERNPKIKTALKFGLYSQMRNRTFTARQLGYTKYGVVGGNINFKESLLFLPEDQIYAQENMGLLEAPSSANGNVGVGGFKLTDGTKFSDAYTAESNLSAGYAMADNTFGDLTLVYGARVEYFQQKLEAQRDNNTPLEINTTKLDILPSLNAIYSITDTANIRFAFSQTINRPEYRELAPFAFYDFTTNLVVSGNDSLQRAKINNLDLRYERFPGRGQMFSVSAFFKHFENPIEQVSRVDVTGEISYKNVPTAFNYGVEVEGRMAIGNIFKVDTSSIFNDLLLFANGSVIRSKVDVSGVVGSATDSRPLQGQSPYIVNAGLTYTHPDKIWTSTLYLNRVGNRIAIVGNTNEPDLWEQARTFLDFQLTYSFWKPNGSKSPKAELKLNVQNILAQDQLYYQNNTNTSEVKGARAVTNALFLGDKNNVTGYQSGIDDEVWRTNFGRTISLGVTFKL